MTTPQFLLAYQDSGQLWPGEPPAPQDVPAAYQTALAVRALRVARGEQPRGYKIGFTNRGIWARYNVHAPIWGPVWNTSLSFCEGNGEIDLHATCQPRIEPEVVFGLRATPVAGASLQDLFDAIDWMAPGFEIVQSHRPEWKFVAADTVADGALHARLLVGPRTPVRSVSPDAPALQRLLAGAGVALQRGGHRVDQGTGANVLDSPLHALHHFVRELRACPGAPDLRPGDVVTTGTWTDAWAVAPGERWTAVFDPPLHPLSVVFRG